MSDQFNAIIETAARKYGVDVDLIRRVIEAESNWDPRATSRAGAQGLMQLMPKTAGSLGVTDPFDPEQNINAGTNYISQMMKRFGGDRRKALAAYNFGPTAVAAGRPWPPETQNYVNKVIGPGEYVQPPEGPFAPPPEDPLGMRRAEADRPDLGTRATSNFMAPRMTSGWDRATGGPGAGVELPTPRPASFPVPPTPSTSVRAGGALQGIGGVVNRFMASQRSGYVPTPEQPPAQPTINARAVIPGEEYIKENFFAPGVLEPGPEPYRPLPSAPTEPYGDEFAGPSRAASVQESPVAPAPRDQSTDALLRHLSDAPREEDYALTGWKKALGILASAGAGYTGGAGQGINTAEHIFRGPYQRAVQAHRVRGEQLGSVARIEDQVADRALRRQQLEQQGRYQDIMGKAATTRAEADRLEAQNRGRFGRIGPESRVPFNQLDDARQAVMERLYATDARAKKFLQPITDKDGNLTGTFTIRPEVERWFGNREFNPQELEELRSLLADIDKMAEGFVGTMVDPYASRQRQPSGGFGVPDDY